MEAPSNPSREGGQPRVLGVLAGGDMPLEQLAAWAKSADVVLAADSGADRLLEARIVPLTTIGDLDSVRSVVPLRRVIRDPGQDSSDCDKLLTLAERIGHTEITLAGVEGDRLDHVLGTLASAARSPLSVRLALRTGLAWVLKGPCEISLETRPGEILSLMPLEHCQGVRLSGVEWPLDGAELAPSVFVSLSNRTQGASISASMSSGSAALFVLAPRLEVPSWDV